MRSIIALLVVFATIAVAFQPAGNSERVKLYSHDEKDCLFHGS